MLFGSMCDQGTSRARGSQLTKNSSKIGSPTGNRAWDAGRDLSEASELAKNENHHILYLVDRSLTPRAAVSRREGEAYRVDGAEILNQVRRFSMPRGVFGCQERVLQRPAGSKGVEGAGSLLVRKEQTDGGQRRRRQILRSPLFTPVDGCSRHSVAVPSSPTDRTAIGSDVSLHMSLGNQ